MSNGNKFWRMYTENLAGDMLTSPARYGGNVSTEKAQEVALKMRNSWPNVIIDKSFAFKQTCKELGIKCTYKSITEFIQG